jgi:hypothetical protein
LITRAVALIDSQARLSERLAQQREVLRADTQLDTNSAAPVHFPVPNPQPGSR